MCVPTQDCTRGWIRFVYNHNPFYVISAALVLYGLHVSFADDLNPAEGWLFTQLLIGYIVLLAATGVLVVRLGQVWEDARTLILLCALLMIALASSFDRVCLDAGNEGARFLACGLAFSIALSELLLRVLKLRFPWAYRASFYSLLALLFIYPGWLGHLSLESRLNEMAWYVLAFPVLAGVVFLITIPAARRRGSDVVDNGTPWGWPLYPWSLFVLLGVGVLLRTYAISLSFDPTKGDGSGFHLYFLVPLLLSWILLWVEGSDQSRLDRKYFAIAVPLIVLVLTLPGASKSAAELRYLVLLQQTLGSPIQIAAALLVAYYAYLWMRGNRLAEFGLVAALGVLTFVDEFTLDVHTLAPVNALPALAIAALLAIGSWWHRSSLRLGIAAVIAIAIASYVWRDTTLTAFRGYLPVHIAFFVIASLGLLFHDKLGRAVARAAAPILIAASVLTLVAHRFLFPGLPAPVHAFVAVGYAAMAAAYWIKNKSFADLQAVVVCLAIAASLVLEHFVGIGLAHLVLIGKRWIAWGALSFLLGLLISLIKSGLFRQSRRSLMRLHLAMIDTLRG